VNRGNSYDGLHTLQAGNSFYTFIILKALSAPAGQSNPVILNTFSILRGTSMHHTTFTVSLIIMPSKLIQSPTLVNVFKERGNWKFSLKLS
jgi:hypothetical protein